MANPAAQPVSPVTKTVTHNTKEEDLLAKLAVELKEKKAKDKADIEQKIADDKDLAKQQLADAKQQLADEGTEKKIIIMRRELKQVAPV